MNCIICGNVSDTNVCYEDNCIRVADCIYIESDNCIESYIKSKKGNKEFLFILKTISKSVSHYEIEDIFIQSSEELDNLNYPEIDLIKQAKDHISDIKIIKTILNSNIDNNLNDLDKMIYESVHSSIYGLIKFIIKRANMNLYFDKEVSQAVGIPGVYKLESIQSQEKNSKYLYHGSGSHNWFSIIYNGLQIYSGTSRMTNGKAFGNGIYLSDSINLSKRYSTGTFATTSRTDYILGVFEVVNSDRYLKSTNIYVVNDKKDIKLKYIINLSNISEDSIKSLGTYLTQDKKKLERNVNTYISKMKNKRLMMEYNKIQKKQFECVESNSDMEFLVDETEDLSTWNVKLINIDSDSNLSKDMKRMKVDFIQLEVKFTDRYPIIPPTIRVVKPGFVPMTGHVTAGGAICFELLTNQGWSPAINMETLFINIKAIISEDGRIKQAIDHSYTEANSKAGRDRFMKAHNWS